tara:strand:- start:541 stop:648 length:108 start_codon:yes stop_codon:yes gene_type:complete
MCKKYDKVPVMIARMIDPAICGLYSLFLFSDQKAL